MAYRVINTEHTGDKRGCASFCGLRADAKLYSRHARRANGRAIIQAELDELLHDEAHAFDACDCEATLRPDEVLTSAELAAAEARSAALAGFVESGGRFESNEEMIDFLRHAGNSGLAS